MAKKKDFGWLVYLIPVFLIIAYVFIYDWIFRAVYGGVVDFFKWLFASPNNIVETLENPDAIADQLWIIIGLKILLYVMIATLGFSFYLIGRRLHFAKPSINESARMIDTAAYFRAMELQEGVKCASGSGSPVYEAVYAICESLRNESDFGRSNDAVTNLENEIATCFDTIEESIDELQKEDTRDAAEQAILAACKKIKGKLKIRTEMKRR